jgi:hypothetical protein
MAFVLKPEWFEPKHVWYSSPTAPRPTGTKIWEETISPIPPLQQMNEDFFDNFVITSYSNGFTVEYPWPKHYSDNAFAFELAEFKPEEPLNIGSATLELSAIGTAYLDANQTQEDQARYRFYDPGFHSIPDAKITQLRSHNFLEPGRSFRDRPFPFVWIGFQAQDVNDLMFHGIKIFDAHTRSLVATGHSISRSENYCWFKTNVSMWHHAPVDVVIDVSYGPSKTFQFAPKAGEGFELGGFKCRLINVFEGGDTSYSTSSDTRRNWIATRIFRGGPDRYGLCFFFACQPQARQMPVTFDFLDKDGQILYGRNDSTSINVHKILLRQPLEKVDLVMARYRTRRRRIVMHLPYIPGLPEENKSIDNLFDTYVPYVSFSRPDEISHFLGRSLQLRNTTTTGRVPAVSINSAAFPMDFNDVTVRDITRRYAQGGKLHTDPNSEQLTREYPIPLRTRIERFLNRIFD